MKKILFFSLIAIMSLSVFTNVFAADTYGVVRDITKQTGDSLSSGNAV